MFTDDNCADFPIAEGWDAANVDTFCKSLLGVDTESVVISQGMSCQVQKGGVSSMTRCTADDLYLDTEVTGKYWYGFGMPDFACDYLNGLYENGPFCDPHQP
jgi:hypothetical protein